MFDFLSSDPAPARRDFSKSIEKDFSGCADFESRALSAGGVSLTLFYLDGCVSAAQISSEIVRPLSLLRARSEHDLLTRALSAAMSVSSPSPFCPIVMDAYGRTSITASP